MKIRTLTDLAHHMYNTGTPQEMELAKEILVLIDDQKELESLREICEDLERYAKGVGDPARQVEWLGDRSDMLAEIEEALTLAGYPCTGFTSADDQVKALIEQLPPRVLQATDGTALEYDL